MNWPMGKEILKQFFMQKQYPTGSGDKCTLAECVENVYRKTSGNSTRILSKQASGTTTSVWKTFVTVNFKI